VRIFFDTNVVLDIIQDREPHALASKLAFEKAKENNHEIFISSLSIANISYILSKKSSKIQPRDTLTTILKYFSCCSLNCDQIKKSLKLLEFEDYEDGLQYLMAVENDCSLIITRDKEGFKAANLQVLTPTDYAENSS